MAIRPPAYGAKRQINPSWGDGSSGAAGGLIGSSAPRAGGASPTGWVNVQDYLSSNAPQAAQMGNAMASDLEKKAADAATQADAYRQQANTYMTQSGPMDPGPNTWFGNPNAPHDPATRKAGIDKWAEQKKAFDAYTPSAAPVAPAAPGEVLSQIQAANTPEGRSTYFSDKAGPTYSQGQANLDGYLAGAGGGGQAVAALGKKYGNILDLINYPFPGYPEGDAKPPTTTAEGQRPTGGTVPTQPVLADGQNGYEAPSKKRKGAPGRTTPTKGWSNA